MLTMNLTDLIDEANAMKQCVRCNGQQEYTVVFHICWKLRWEWIEKSYLLINKPMTISCIRMDLEKQIVFRAKRLIRVRKVKCLRSIFCVFFLPIR